MTGHTALVNRTAKIISSEGRQAEVEVGVSDRIRSSSIQGKYIIYIVDELENNFATNDLSIISIPVLNRKVSYQNLQNL